MDFERKFWDEQTPITPQELNRIESGIESLYERIKIYTGKIDLGIFSLDPKEVRTYTVSCPGARSNHFALASLSSIVSWRENPLSMQAKAYIDEVEVRIENITDISFNFGTSRIYVATLYFPGFTEE